MQYLEFSLVVCDAWRCEENNTQAYKIMPHRVESLLKYRFSCKARDFTLASIFSKTTQAAKRTMGV